MTFTGLPIGQLGLVFAAGSALLVAFYLLKLRRRAIAVPFAPLWQRVLRERQATSLFSRLKSLLSLLLQLLLLALLVLALGDPRLGDPLREGRSVVVLVDASASMQATDVGTNRLEVAKETVRTLVRSLGGADRVLLAQMDAAVTPLGPMSGDAAELERGLGQIHPTEAPADFPRALRFAADALRGLARPEIVVVSDGRLDARDAPADARPRLDGIRLSFARVGKSGRNVGVTQFAVRRYPLDKSRYEVMLEVTNTGADAEDVELTLLGDGQVVEVSRLRLGPGERLPRFYANLSGASRTLEAKLSLPGGGHDDLPADDHAYAELPARRRARVLVVTPGNLYLDAALLLDEYLDVTRVDPKAYAERYAAAARTFDVAIFDGVTPLETPATNALYMDPRGDGAPVKVGAAIAQLGFDTIDRKHPIVRFTALEEVNIGAAHTLVPAPGDRVVGASEQGPILVAGERAGRKFVVFGFDVGQSDLPLRVAWPVLLLNTLDWFVGDDASYLSGVRTGDVWRIPVSGSPSSGARATARVTFPGGASSPVPVHEGRAVLLGERAGFYEVDAGDGTKSAFAANLLDARESAIAPAAELTVDGRVAGNVEGFHAGVRRELWLIALLVVALVSLVEWATYHRRLTV